MLTTILAFCCFVEIFVDMDFDIELSTTLRDRTIEAALNLRMIHETQIYFSSSLQDRLGDV